jgi:TolB-like protein/Tfp pilus assembly protein PilF
MATGKRAFHGDSSIQTLSAIIEKEPEAISVLKPEISPQLRIIVERCLAKDPEERYDSTRDLARELKSIDIAPPTIRETAKPIRSLVVLPLANLSPDPEQEYFSDGMTEALITDLAKIGALKVISRTSAMRYKKTDKSMLEIGRELNVDAVVEGSVLRAGNRVRITAQLIKADADEHLWAESYERDLEDILFLQSDVARAIAGEIRARLTPGEETRFGRAQSVNPSAHEACLKGRYHCNKMTADGLRKAIDYFERAIEVDPSYAPAYAGLAWAIGESAFWGYTATRDAAPKGKEAVVKAVELDSTLADAYCMLGGLKLFFDWEWPAAEAALIRAIELNPGYAEAHRLYAHYLLVTGRESDALREAKRAVELDPLSPIANQNVGAVLEYSRHYNEAIEHYMKTLELEPNFVPAHVTLVSAYWKKGMYKEAFAELKTVLTLIGRSEPVEVMEKSYSVTGFKGAAKAAAEKLEALSKHRYVLPYLVAYIYSYAEMGDRVMNWLERAYGERDMAMIYLRVAPWWDKWRSDPRFQDLVRRMNFPP